MKYSALLVAILLLAILAADSSPQATPSAGQRDWPAYGGGPDDTRYSPLDQINRENVPNLQAAWSYDTGEKGGLETSPIVVDSVLYGITPAQKISRSMPQPERNYGSSVPESQADSRIAG